MVPTVAAALLLAGCAGAGPSTVPGSTGSAVSTGSVGSTDGSPSSGGGVLPTNVAPVAPGEPVPVGPTRIDASAVPGGYTGRMTLDLTGTRLTINATEGNCSTTSAELLGQDARSVSVRLVVSRTSDGICSAIARLVPLTVALAEPLGTRTVVLSEVHL